MPRPKKEVPDSPVSVRFPLPIMAQIKFAAKAMGKSESEVIRMATEIGLEKLKRIGHQTAKVLLDAAEEEPTLRVAEDAPKYGKGSEGKK